MVYILKYLGNYFKIALNKMIYKMTLLPLPEVRGVTHTIFTISSYRITTGLIHMITT